MKRNIGTVCEITSVMYKSDFVHHGINTENISPVMFEFADNSFRNLGYHGIYSDVVDRLTFSSSSSQSPSPFESSKSPSFEWSLPQIIIGRDDMRIATRLVMKHQSTVVHVLGNTQLGMDTHSAPRCITFRVFVFNWSKSLSFTPK